MRDDANARLRCPCGELIVVADERELVETLLRIDERRVDARQIDDDVAIARVGILRDAAHLQIALAEVARDVVVGVDAREAEPRAIAGAALAFFDVHVDLRKSEDVLAGLRIAAQHRESEGTDRERDVERGGARGESELQRSGIRSSFDGDFLLLSGLIDEWLCG